jgi:hypothetical protein
MNLFRAWTPKAWMALILVCVIGMVLSTWLAAFRSEPSNWESLATLRAKIPAGSRFKVAMIESETG